MCKAPLIKCAKSNADSIEKFRTHPIAKNFSIYRPQLLCQQPFLYIPASTPLEYLICCLKQDFSMQVDAKLYKSHGLIFNGNIYKPFSFEPPVEIGVGTSIFSDVSIGAHSYINGGIIREHVQIGRFCSIADKVVIGAPNHATDLLSTHPFATKSQQDALFGRPFLKQKNISRQTVIGDDVWIGINSTIIEGVTIGTGAVVGAGAVVTKNIPPYAICGGVPAKVIGYRFPPDLIEKLIQSKWWMHSKDFLSTLPTNNIERCIEKIKKNSEPYQYEFIKI